MPGMAVIAGVVVALVVAWSVWRAARRGNASDDDAGTAFFPGHGWSSPTSRRADYHGNEDISDAGADSGPESD